MIMIVAYAGGVITFLVLTKGGSCVFVRCFAGSYRPPSGRNNEQSPKRNCNKVTRSTALNMILHHTFIYFLFIGLAWIFQTIHALVSCMGVCAGFVTVVGELNQGVSDQIVEWSVHDVGCRGPLKGPWWGPGATPRWGSRGQSPQKLLGF